MSTPDEDKKSAFEPVALHTTSNSFRNEKHSDEGGTFEVAHDQGKLQNPLTRFSKDELLRKAEQFAADKGLQSETDLIKRGALVAQNPASFHDISELSQEEKAALQHEITHKWSHPILLYLTIFACSIGAATQGWDQTGSNVSTKCVSQHLFESSWR